MPNVADQNRAPLIEFHNDKKSCFGGVREGVVRPREKSPAAAGSAACGGGVFCVVPGGIFSRRCEPLETK